jgi:DNA gyrase subunit A
MVTHKGVIKRVEASAFAKIRVTGIKAMTLQEDDRLAFCSLSSGSNSIILATAKGLGIRFAETEVRAMGRQAGGVRGIKLTKNDFVAGMQVLPEDKDILFATSRGYGKRVRVGDFRVAHRGGKGVKTIPADKRNGVIIGLVVVDDATDVLLIDDNGKIMRLSSQEVRTMGRQARGVRLIRLGDDRVLAGITAIDKESSCSAPGVVEDDENASSEEQV